MEGVDGYFVHPVRDDPVIAGNGTIGLELVEDLDDFDAVLIPWGGGGLTTGIASAVKALRPETEIYVCEPETGAPVTAAIANGRAPTKIEYTPSFIDGAGSGALLPEMWAHARAARHRRVLDLARGCGGGRAAARSSADASSARARPGSRSPRRWPGSAATGRVVCIVSGGNIDPRRLAAILEGRVPD